jgi:hypothetical protein
MENGGKQIMRKGNGTVYRIIVRSELSATYAVAFEGMEMETKDGDTVLIRSPAKAFPNHHAAWGHQW